MPEPNVVLVNDQPTLKRLKKALRGSLAFDIETTGLYPWHGDIVSVGLGTADTQYVIPWNHAEAKLNPKDVVEELDPIIQDCQLITQFGKFDALWMRVKHGVDWVSSFDVGLAHYLLDENSPHDLEFLAKTYLDQEPWDVPLDVKQGKHGIAGKHAHYLGLDLQTTRALRFKLGAELDKYPKIKQVFNHILMPCLRLFTEIEFNGVYIDKSKFSEAEDYLTTEIARTLNQLKQWQPPNVVIKRPKKDKIIEFNWGSPKQVGELLFDKLKIKCVEKTPTGKPSTSESTLKQIDHPLVESLLAHRGAKQQMSFFIEGWKPWLIGDYLHPSFKLHGTVTGRLCLRGGTQIMVPGGTRPIELIKPGDWVYSFDDNKKLCLQRVISAGYSGHKPCYRVHWLGSGGQHSGYLDATDNHPIRLTNGLYKNVSELKGGKLRLSRGKKRWHGGEHVLALHRQADSRNYLYATGYSGKLIEARVVFESIQGWSPEHVHHKDLNPLNDCPGNLVGMTHSEHAALHMALVPQLEKEQRSIRHIDRQSLSYVEGRRRATAKLRKRAESRFTQSEVKEALERGHGIIGASKLLNCNYGSLRRRMDKWGLSYDGRSNNHLITHIEPLSGLYATYDIEVEGTPNFIANELCVHNSAEHPNLQQVPRDPRIRQLISAPPGWDLIEADLSQIELRIAAELANEAEMLYAFTHGIDVHWLTLLRELRRNMAMPEPILDTAAKIVGRRLNNYQDAVDALLKAGPDAATEVDAIWKELRKKAKAINFGFLYGMWWKKFRIYARDNYGVHVSAEEAQESRESFFELYNDLPAWHRKQQRLARRQGYIETLSGRRRHLPDATLREDTPARAEALRQAINSPVQSFANELNLMAALQLREEYPRSIVQICGTVHDAVLARVKRPHTVEVSERLLEIMRGPKLLKTFGIELSVPIEADLKIGPWSKGISLKKYKEQMKCSK